MFNIGDTIIYSEHGLCEIDDICDQTIAGITRTYYILHPLADTNLKISTPVDNDKVLMLRTMNGEEAEMVLQTFNQPGIEWIEDSRQRNKEYADLVHSGDRNEIAKIVNTLIRKNAELKMGGKRIYDQDRKLLQTTQNILFNELALSLDTSYEEIEQRVNEMLQVK
ncbi:CarD family transcriptional regulator [Niallia sp. Krafla_26]|uniref:CarD family transcriptional regulator n=1 Tax=Niallia sp. Krafla_26 TaxID=3064703 RepID=UPI003D16447B